MTVVVGGRSPFLGKSVRAKVGLVGGGGCARGEDLRAVIQVLAELVVRIDLKAVHKAVIELDLCRVVAGGREVAACTDGTARWSQAGSVGEVVELLVRVKFLAKGADIADSEEVGAGKLPFDTEIVLIGQRVDGVVDDAEYRRPGRQRGSDGADKARGILQTVAGRLSQEACDSIWGGLGGVDDEIRERAVVEDTEAATQDGLAVSEQTSRVR